MFIFFITSLKLVIIKVPYLKDNNRLIINLNINLWLLKFKIIMFSNLLKNYLKNFIIKDEEESLIKKVSFYIGTFYYRLIVNTISVPLFSSLFTLISIL